MSLHDHKNSPPTEGNSHTFTLLNICLYFLNLNLNFKTNTTQNSPPPEGWILPNEKDGMVAKG